MLTKPTGPIALTLPRATLSAGVQDWTKRRCYADSGLQPRCKRANRLLKARRLAEDRRRAQAAHATTTVHCATRSADVLHTSAEMSRRPSSPVERSEK